MTSACETLVSRATDNDCATTYDHSELEAAFSSPAAILLSPLLSKCNGFFAFDRALHVLSSRQRSLWGGLAGWNNPSLWAGCYEGLLEGVVCFAQDVFGIQFCLRDSRIYSFDPETSEFTSVASSVEEWASAVLEDPALMLGANTAAEWKVQHGLLPLSERLAPKMPFVFGGEYSLDNLVSRDAVEAIRAAASVAMQIKGLPDGTTLKVLVTE